MSKRNQKLALKRESLRNLNAQELGQVGGGLYYAAYNLNYYDNTIEWVILKQPAPSTSRTDSGFAINYYYAW
jgi:hypothetical protein